MRKLQCELCGGQLMMEDGVAVCQYCGMRFSKEEVKVSGVDDAETLYRRAKDFEILEDYAAVERTYQQMTATYPGDYRGWIGRAEFSATPRIITRKVRRYFCLSCKSFVEYSEWNSFRPLSCIQCKAFGHFAEGNLPLLLNINDVENTYDSYMNKVIHYMSQAMKVAGPTLQNELNAYQVKLLEQKQVKIQQMLRDAEEWNRKAQEEIDAWCEKQLELDSQNKAKAERERVVKEQGKAAEKVSKQLEWKEMERQWSQHNAEFLRQFSSESLAELFGYPESSFIDFITIAEPTGARWVKQWCTPIEIKLTYAFGNRLAGTYVYQNKSYSAGSKKRKGCFDVTIGYDEKRVSGDVRPLMDGKEICIRGLFSTKKVIYHYNSDET